MNKLLMILAITFLVFGIGYVIYTGVTERKTFKYHKTYTPEERERLERLNEEQRQERLKGKREMPDSHSESKKTDGEITIGMHRSEIKAKGNYQLRMEDG